MSRLLVFDPSGNASKTEGYGVTGWAVFDDGELSEFGTIKSEDCESQEEYWLAHWELIESRHDRALHLGPFYGDGVLMESYQLFAHKAQQQSWSSMDTPQLIGYLRMKCWDEGLPLHFQNPSDKARVNDDILVKHGIFEKRGNRYYCQGKPTVIHARDAIRHGIFFYKFGKGKELLKQSGN